MSADVELPEKISGLDCAPSGRSHLGNSNSESQSPGFSGSSSGTLALSESSIGAIPESECKSGSLEKKLVKCELNDSSGDKWEYRALVGEDAFMTSIDSDNTDELDDAKPSESGISSDENEKNTVHTGKISNLLKQKRLRKPTKRFIEEFSAPKSKHLMETEKNLATPLKVKHLKIKSRDKLHHGGALTYLLKEESLSETISQEMPDDDEKLSDLRTKCMTEKQKFFSSASKDKLLKVGSQNEFNRMRGFKYAPREESCTVTSTRAAFESRPQRGRPRKPPSVSVGKQFSLSSFLSII